MRVQLEPLEERHAAELFELLQDHRLYSFIPEDPPEFRQKLAERYRFLEARKSPDGSELWLNWVMRNESGEPVGTLQATVEADRTAYVAYMVFAKYWRMGYAKAGLETMLELLERSFSCTVAKALVDTRNVASWKLLERLGFERSGFRPHADEFKGRVSDEFEYRLKLAQ